MKKVVSIFAIFILIFAITSCGKTTVVNNEKSYIDVNEVNEVTSVENDIEVISVSSISEKCKFIFHVDVPENFVIDRMEQIYLKEDDNSESYDLLHDYLFHYTDEDEMEFTIKCSDIDFPVKDYEFGDASANPSSIIGTDVVIYHNANTYYALFNYKDLYFDIEFVGLDEGAVQIILESICKEYKEALE